MGCAPLGELFVRVDDAAAQATLQAAWDGGIRYFDTAPEYGFGLSEHRVGQFLRQRPRDEFVLSTKVGRLLQAPRDVSKYRKTFWTGGLDFDFRFDYGYDAIMRSVEDSYQRLGLNRVDVLLIHDLDVFTHGSQLQVDAYLQPVADRWLAGAVGAARQRRGWRDRCRIERCGDDAASAGDNGSRFHSAGDALHAAGTRYARCGATSLCRERRGPCHRRRVQLRHHGDRSGARGLLQLRACDA